MFASGVVKLASGDESWWNLTALTFHYETQPLPTWIGWYLHQLPVGWQKLSTVIVFLTELVLPFLIFGWRTSRHLAGIAFVVLMILIALSGNYGYFNYLTIVLCLPLFDDSFWRRRERKTEVGTAEHRDSIESQETTFEEPRRRFAGALTWPGIAVWPAVALIVFMSPWHLIFRTFRVAPVSYTHLRAHETDS